MVQPFYPVFPKVEEGELTLQKKIQLIRDALKEVARAKVALVHTYANDIERVNKKYENELESVKEQFRYIKEKMDAARSTKKIQDIIQKIKDTKTQIAGSEEKLALTMANVRNISAES